jgi:hypothetical protein
MQGIALAVKEIVEIFQDFWLRAFVNGPGNSGFDSLTENVASAYQKMSNPDKWSIIMKISYELI